MAVPLAVTAFLHCGAPLLSASPSSVSVTSKKKGGEACFFASESVTKNMEREHAHTFPTSRDSVGVGVVGAA